MMRPSQRARAWLVTACLLTVCAVIMLSLYRIQIVQHEFFSSYGHQQYTTTLTHIPARGNMYDRWGTPLALTVPGYAACLLHGTFQDPVTTKHLLDELAPGLYEREAYREHTAGPFMYISRSLSATQASYVKGIAGRDIHLLEEARRLYPYPCCSPLLGCTDIDLQGISGLELRYDALLRGTVGSYTIQRDARGRGRYFNKTMLTPGTPGAPLHTTLDADLTFMIAHELQAAAQRLSADLVVAVLLDPVTGEIRALAQWPWYEPDAAHPHHAPEYLTNHALCSAWELGSVIKVFCALAALEEGVVTPDEVLDCQDTKEGIVQGMPVRTWKADGCIPFRDVLRRSNNIGIAQVSCRLGKKLHDHYTRRLGFTHTTGCEIPGEQTGSITPPRSWSKATPISLSYGYELRATLLQLARAFGIIVQDGVPCTPHVIVRPMDPYTLTPVYRAETCQTLKGMLDLHTGPLAYLYKDLSSYRLYGKTGTAKAYRHNAYQDDYNYFSFVGGIERDDYKRVLVVHVHKQTHAGEFASTVALPLWSQLAHRIIIHERTHHTCTSQGTP